LVARQKIITTKLEKGYELDLINSQKLTVIPLSKNVTSEDTMLLHVTNK